MFLIALFDSAKIILLHDICNDKLVYFDIEIDN